MYIEGDSPPIYRYFAALLRKIVDEREVVHRVTRSQGLPDLPGFPAPPDGFGAFWDRAMLACGADPGTRPPPWTSHFDVTRTRDEPGGHRVYDYRFNIAFTDAHGDPCVELRPELTGSVFRLERRPPR